MKTFIKEHRDFIDRVIKSECPNCENVNDSERELWVLNNEQLYLLARDKGVKI